MNPQPTPNASHSHTAQAGQHHSDACVAATFGESFVSQRLAGAPARYTFSACRGMRRLDPKDSETGYSYFGARYYESGLSIWLSVDPLADKYPSLSSYVYCANNPVILVDPDGRDIITVDDQGNCSIKEAEGDDVLMKGSESVTLSGNGVFAAAYSYDKEKNHTTLEGMSKSDALATMRFMSENTKVEWGYMEYLENNESHYMVGSAHHQDKESYVYEEALKKTPGSVIRYDHSHPVIEDTRIQNATGIWPSNEDKQAWADILKVHTKISLGIRFKDKYNMQYKNGEKTW